MAGKRFVAPDLSNATPTSLLDEMAALSMIENQAKKLRAFYKEAYYARVGIKELTNGEYSHEALEGDAIVERPFPDSGVTKEGENFIATTTLSRPQRISTTLLKEKHPEIAEECTVPGVQLTTRFTLREGVVNPIVNDLIAQMKKELDLD